MGLSVVNATLRKSHFQYAKTYHDATGIKKFFWFRKPVNKSKPSHMSCAIKNYDGSLTQTLFYLDFDFKLAIEEWKNGGQLDYDGIKERFFEEFPFLKDYFVASCRSTSLTGLHFIFAFSPFEITREQNKVVRDNYMKLGSCLIRACQALGFGADGSAWGLNRLTMNYHNTKYCIEHHEDSLKRAWYGDGETKLESGRFRRDNTLSYLLTEIRKHPLIRYQKKSEQWLKSDSDLLYPDSRVEKKIAKLLLHTWDEEYGKFYTSNKQLEDDFCFNPATLRKLVNQTLPCGLKIERLSPRELCVTWDRGVGFSYYSRAKSVLSNKVGTVRQTESDPVDIFSLNSLPLPSELDTAVDGNINRWLVSATVWLKFAGVSEDRARAIVGNAAPLISGWTESRKASDWEKRVGSIYRCRPETFASIAGLELPGWLLDFEFTRPLIPSSENKKTKNVKKFKKVYLSLLLDFSFQKEKLQMTTQGAERAKPSPEQRKKEDFLSSPAFSLLQSIVPKAAESMKNGGGCADRVEEKDVLETNTSFSSFRLDEKVTPFYETEKIDPINRFEAALQRCVSKRTFSLIKNKLKIEAPKMVEGYAAPEGAYKRVLVAFSKCPLDFRISYLNQV